MRINLTAKILAITLLPLAALGAAIIFISLTSIKGALMDEVRNSLKGTASAVLAAYDQNSGDYTRLENGSVWKGGYNISKSDALVDGIKDNSGMDITFFYGSERIMTSAKDKNGNRILGSPAGEKIVSTVLKGGSEYFSSAVSIDGTLCYGYYIPVYQKGNSSEAVGMIFVGTNKADKDAAINEMIKMIIKAVIIVMAACMLLSLILSLSITTALKSGIKFVSRVSGGELGVSVNKRFLSRRDEIGDLSVAVSSLQSKLRVILRQVAEGSDKLYAAASELETTSGKTNHTMQAVESSVNVITQNISEQARDTQNTSENIMLMGERINDTSKAVGFLTENADIMRKSGEQAAETIRQLLEINKEVETAVKAVTKQTDRTNKSAVKIRETSKLISSIADETNILSVNARIEAASAGAAGKGFAVVASQIKDLAAQSNQSSREIEQIVNELIKESNEAVNTMERAQKIINDLSSIMLETEKSVTDVILGINDSLQNIGNIGKITVMLEESRNKIVEAVSGLTDIAHQNAAGTKETRTQTSEVADTFGRIFQSAGELKEIAADISKSMEYFHL